MKRLKPNAKYKCIKPYHWFTLGNIYQSNEEGVLIDDDGDKRYRLSIADSFFFEKFKLLKP